MRMGLSDAKQFRFCGKETTGCPAIESQRRRCFGPGENQEVNLVDEDQNLLGQYIVEEQTNFEVDENEYQYMSMVWYT